MAMTGFERAKDDLIRENRKLSEKVEKLSSLLTISKLMAAQLDLDSLLGLIIDQMSKVMGSDRCSLFIYDAEKNELWSRVAHGLRYKEIRFNIDTGIGGYVFRSGETVYVPDAYADSRFNREFDLKTGYRTADILSAPMVNDRGEKVGVVELLNKKGGRGYAEDELELFLALTNLATIPLENARLFRLAVTDGLTGLFTKRYFEIRLKEEIERSKRTGHKISLLFLDLDYFKRVNDTYGHPAGDRVLRIASVRLQRMLRISDAICRYGGEEFASILPETGKEAATIIAERLRKVVSFKPMVVDQKKSIAIKATASVGLATCPDDSVDVDDLIGKADKALYHAKETGRDRTVVYYDGLS